MNHQFVNSTNIHNSSTHSSLSPLVAPDPKQAVPADAPLPKATRRTSKSPAKPDAPKAAANKNDDRCRHHTAAGRRCRLAILDPASGLCFRHVGRQFQRTDEDLSSAFVGLLSGFQSPSRIHAFLTQVTVLLVQNRVSTRRAAILAYLGQTLLRTLPAINDELNPPNENQPIIFDIPSAVATRAAEARAAAEAERAKNRPTPNGSSAANPNAFPIPEPAK